MLLPPSSITSAVLPPTGDPVAQPPIGVRRADVGPGLEATVNVVDGSAHVWLRGDVCTDTVARLAGVLAELQADSPGHEAVVVDLAEVTLLSAAGVTLIVEQRNAWSATGPVLVLANARGVVARVLDVCGIPLLPVHGAGR